MIRLFGGILLAVGMLIAGTSGLCSLFFLISMIGQGAPEGLLMILVLGGIPFGIGSGLSWVGWKLMKSNPDN